MKKPFGLCLTSGHEDAPFLASRNRSNGAVRRSEERAAREVTHAVHVGAGAGSKSWREYRQ
jgi:hypothetical protein